MKQCNRCTNRKCDRITLHRRRKVQLSVRDMQSNCPRVKSPTMYGEKLLVLAMGTNPQGVHDTLQDAGFRLQELAEYPYFKMIVDERKGGKRGG